MDTILSIANGKQYSKILVLTTRTDEAPKRTHNYHYYYHDGIVDGGGACGSDGSHNLLLLLFIVCCSYCPWSHDHHYHYFVQYIYDCINLFWMNPQTYLNCLLFLIKSAL